jgi:hypothetical protein
VKYNTNEITTVKTEFLNNNVLRRKNNYHVDIDKVIDDIILIDVRPNENLDIIIKSNPKSYIVMKILSNGNYDMISEVKDSDKEVCSITTPNKVGKNIYSISVNYVEGVGIYYFLVDVKNEN